MRIRTVGKVESVHRRASQHYDSTTIKIGLPDEKSVEFRVQGECETPKPGGKVSVYIEWATRREGEHVDTASLGAWQRLKRWLG